MPTANNRPHRAAAGALALAALTALVALAPTASAAGDCLAWYGSRGDGICLGYSNGTPTYIGTPALGVWGPGYGNNIPGMSTGPLLPGQTINTPIGGN